MDMAPQVFQTRSRVRRSLLAIAALLPVAAVGALALILVASAIAPAGMVELPPFVSVTLPTPGPTAGTASTSGEGAAPTPQPVVTTILNGAGQVVGAAVAAITAPLRPTATPTATASPVPTATSAPSNAAPTTQPTPRGQPPATPPGRTPPPH
jgi:hypothetical protein